MSSFLSATWMRSFAHRPSQRFEWISRTMELLVRVCPLSRRHVWTRLNEQSSLFHWLKSLVALINFHDAVIYLFFFTHVEILLGMIDRRYTRRLGEDCWEISGNLDLVEGGGWLYVTCCEKNSDPVRIYRGGGWLFVLFSFLEGVNW